MQHHKPYSSYKLNIFVIKIVSIKSIIDFVRLKLCKKSFTYAFKIHYDNHMHESVELILYISNFLIIQI